MKYKTRQEAVDLYCDLHDSYYGTRPYDQEDQIGWMSLRRLNWEIQKIQFYLDWYDHEAEIHAWIYEDQNRLNIGYPYEEYEYLEATL